MGGINWVFRLGIERTIEEYERACRVPIKEEENEMD